jgi:outer membrane protein OmpA-like peptidoglycan-associated protein
MNIIETIKGEMNADLKQSLATVNSESIEKTENAIDAASYAVMLSLLKRSAQESGLAFLYKITKEGNYGANNLPSSIFVNDNINKIADEGNSLISKLIPDKKSPLITLTSSYSGVRNASSNRILGVMMVLIMNKIKEQIVSKNLDSNGLAELLVDQKDHIIEQAPTALISKISGQIGLGNLVNLSHNIINSGGAVNTKMQSEDNKTQTDNESRYTNNETNSGGFKNWIIPAIFGGLVLLAGGYYWYSNFYNNNSSTNPQPDSLVTIPTDSLKLDSTKAPKDTLTVQTKTDTVVVELSEITLPNGQKLSLESNSLSAQVQAFLADTSKANTKKIAFSGEAFSTGTTLEASANEQLNTVGQILKAYTGSGIKVAARTFGTLDSTASDRPAIQRALAIKKLLVSQGVPTIRVDAVGRMLANSERGRTPELELTIMKK